MGRYRGVFVTLLGDIREHDANSNNGALVKFDVSSNVLCAEGGKAIAEALKNNQVMTDLNIASNYLSEDSDDKPDMSGVIAISNAIPTMGALTSLNISSNSLGGYFDTRREWISDMSGVKALAAAIPECK